MRVVICILTALGQWTVVTDQNYTQYIQTGLNLGTGHKYFLRVAAMNGAGLVATHETNGVIVDNTPPVVSNIASSFFIIKVKSML